MNVGTKPVCESVHAMDGRNHVTKRKIIKLYHALK